MQVRGRAANQDQPTERQNTTLPARYTDCLPVIAHDVAVEGVRSVEKLYHLVVDDDIDEIGHPDSWIGDIDRRQTPCTLLDANAC